MSHPSERQRSRTTNDYIVNRVLVSTQLHKPNIFIAKVCFINL